MIDGRRRLLTIEVKGQWHEDLFSAASAQLWERYSNNPDAEQQGIYLVLWFGPSVKVAGRKNTKYKTAEELREAIAQTMPVELRGLIDVQMVDLSGAAAEEAATKAAKPSRTRNSTAPPARKKRSQAAD